PRRGGTAEPAGRRVPRHFAARFGARAATPPAAVIHHSSPGRETINAQRNRAAEQTGVRESPRAGLPRGAGVPVRHAHGHRRRGRQVFTDAGTGNDNIDVNASALNNSLTVGVNAGTGDDEIDVRLGGVALNNSVNLFLSGGTGNDSVQVNASGTVNGLLNVNV